MAKTMLDVLDEHNDWAWSGERREVLCIGCDWSQKIPVIDPAAPVFRAHQAAALTAAGYGLVADAKREAWEEAADHIMGPSDVLLDGATCRWNAMELRERAAEMRQG